MDYKKEIKRLEEEHGVLNQKLANNEKLANDIRQEILRIEGEHRFCVRQEGILKDQGEGDDTKGSEFSGP